MKQETVDKVLKKLKELGYDHASFSRDEFVIPTTHRDRITLAYIPEPKKFVISLQSRYVPPSIVHVNDVVEEVHDALEHAKELNRIILEDS